MATFVGTLQIRNGLNANLPSEANLGEPLYTTDNGELWIGNGVGNPLTGPFAVGSGGGGGAPTNADYLVRTANGSLSAERVVTDSATIVWNWGTPGQAAAEVPAGTFDLAGSASAVLAALESPEYLVRTANPSLTAERVVTNTATITWDFATAGQAKANIPDGGVTFAKIENKVGNQLLGYTSVGAGPPVTVLLGSPLEINAGNLQIAALGIVNGHVGDNQLVAGKLAATTTKRVFGRNTAAAGGGEEVTLSQLLDWIGSAAQGDILFRGAAGWSRLAAGIAGLFLKTGGSGADPSWDMPIRALFNNSTASQGPGFAADTYVTGSTVTFTNAQLKAGTKYVCRFMLTKTAVGTATPIATVRTGTLGTTGDTARTVFTFNAQTAAADEGIIEIEVVFTAVGATAGLRGMGRLFHRQSITGLQNAVSVVKDSVHSPFDVTSATKIGLSLNMGASANVTVVHVSAEMTNIN